MTAETLNGYTAKDLAQMAKKRGVDGWHSMKKDQLVKAILRAQRAKSPKLTASAKSSSKSSVAPSKAKSSRSQPSRPQASRPHRRSAKAPTLGAAARHKTNGRVAESRRKSSPAKTAVVAKSPVVQRRLQQAKVKVDSLKNLAARGEAGATAKDRLVVMVRDSYWLHANWELSRHGVERAQAALGQDWHGARPVLRLYQVSSGGATTNAETPVRDIAIHGGVSNWYIDVQDPPCSFRLDIGYLTVGGRFFVLARSNAVTTPKAGICDTIDENWSAVAENFEKIYAMSGGNSPEGPHAELQELFEERLRRPMGAPLVGRFGPSAEGLIPKKREFSFELDAEMIVFGQTEPNAHVTLQGDPIRVRPDGTFTVRFSMPNCRQVIPAVASSADGLEQRTIVLAVERNTKTMEPLIRDSND